MIASIQGTVEARGPDFVVINVGGIGLRVFAPVSTLSSVGEPGSKVRLDTHLYFKEDTIALYGFLNQEELRLFQMLLDVAGMGPRTALSALSVMSAPALATAIVSDDVDSLKRIPGVGGKTAARMALELKGKLGKDPVVMTGLTLSSLGGDAVAALAALGYGQAEARAALGAVEDLESLSVEEQIRRALQHIAGA